MASGLDDLIRREREKANLLNTLPDYARAFLKPARDYEQLIAGIVSPSVASALQMHEAFLGRYGSALVQEDATSKFLEEATKINRLIDTERRAFADATTLSTNRILEQAKQIIAPSIVDQLRAIAPSSLISEFSGALADSAARLLRNIAFPDIRLSALSTAAYVSRFMDAATRPAAAASMLADFLREAEQLASSGVVVTPEGVAVDTDVVDAAALTAHLRDVVRHAVAVPRSERFREFLAQCLVIIGSAPKPVAKALIAVLSMVFLWIAEGEVQAISTELLAPTRQLLMSKIRKLTGLRSSAPDTPRPSSSRLRVVIAKDTLNVRIYPRTSDSRIVGQLELGTVVVAQRDVKDWTLVEYREEESVIRGWVYTRYLKRVVLPPTMAAF